MSIDNFVKKLRSRPQKERERIAVVATGASFAIILVIWLISFSETNKDIPAESSTSTVEQLRNLKSNLGESKKSIEEMWSQMPTGEDMNSPIPAPESNTSEFNSANVENRPSDGMAEDQNQDTKSPQDDRQEIPNLP